MSDFKENGQVEGNEFVTRGIDKPDEVGAVLVSLEMSKVLELELFLKNYPIVVFIDIDPNGLLSFNIFGY